ncbi:MAG: lipoate--protein ligase [Desulfovibrio sp.]|nr:lipoate--protein ligase [Desulfovibrio sp.]
MRFIHNTSTDPAFNLACEEWLLKHSEEDVFMLWRNAPAVIVGRNQNTLSQIDEEFVRTRKIPVIRRLSGGGAMFHDLGNINFTFIDLKRSGEGLDFRRFTEPILDALRHMGVPCEFDGRNDLVIKGQKFSGNAQHIHQNRVLHHGTLLFSSQIADLSGALRVDPEKYRDKAVKSVRKRVTNIASHLPEPMSVDRFLNRLMAHVATGADRGDMSLAQEEIRAVETLAEEKYRTWEWNFGYSPQYGLIRKNRTPGGLLEVHLDVNRGEIAAVRLFGDYFGSRDVGELEALLRGCRHEREALRLRLADLPLEQYLRDVTMDDFLDSLF